METRLDVSTLWFRMCMFFWIVILCSEVFRRLDWAQIHSESFKESILATEGWTLLKCSHSPTWKVFPGDQVEVLPGSATKKHNAILAAAGWIKSGARALHSRAAERVWQLRQRFPREQMALAQLPVTGTGQQRKGEDEGTGGASRSNPQGLF